MKKRSNVLLHLIKRIIKWIYYFVVCVLLRVNEHCEKHVIPLSAPLRFLCRRKTLPEYYPGDVKLRQGQPAAPQRIELGHGIRRRFGGVQNHIEQTPWSVMRRFSRFYMHLAFLESSMQEKPIPVGIINIFMYFKC